MSAEQEPQGYEYPVAPEVKRPPPTTFPHWGNAASDSDQLRPDQRQFSLRQAMLAMLLLGLLMMPAQWFSPAEYAGTMGLATLGFLMFAALTSLRGGAIALITGLLLAVYLLASLIAAWD